MRQLSRSADPAQGAAELMRRLGMAILVVGLPCAAYFWRGAAIVLMPFGAVILFLATVIDPAEPIGARLKLFARSSDFYIMLALALWAGLTLLWAPFPKPGGDRFFNAAATLLIAAGALAALPERMRAPALYLLPIGAFASVVAACLIVLHARGVIRVGPIDPAFVSRGAAALMLVTPVALGWLMSRGRGPEALALAVAALCAAFILGDVAIMACFIATLIAFAATRLSPGAGAKICVAIAIAIVLAAPLIPIAAAPVAEALGFRDVAAMLRGLAEAVWREGARVLTGHGLETTPRAVGVGILPLPGAPLLVAIWYDLGVLGALGLAAFLWSRVRRAGARPPDIAAAEIGLACAAVTQMVLGVATMQAWWLSTIAAAVIAMRAAAQGQFRTRRPRARLFSRAREAAEG